MSSLSRAMSLIKVRSVHSLEFVKHHSLIITIHYRIMPPLSKFNLLLNFHGFLLGLPFQFELIAHNLILHLELLHTTTLIFKFKFIQELTFTYRSMSIGKYLRWGSRGGHYNYITLCIFLMIL